MRIIFCIYGDTYKKELDIAIKSIRLWNNNPIVVINSYPSVEESAGGRLRILEDIPYEENEIILYLDADIVTLSKINLPDPKDKVCVYGYPHRDNHHSSFAGFITSEKDILSKPSINSGILLFRATQSNRELFKFIHHQYITGKKNACWEQPYINYWLHKKGTENINLNPFVIEHRYNDKVSDQTQFVHFCGMRGGSRHKMMEGVLDKHTEKHLRGR